MIRRSEKDVQADVIRLIVTTREKFPHSVAWNEALKRVVWRYAAKRRRKSSGRRAPKK